jgi:hypothetical protein
MSGYDDYEDDMPTSTLSDHDIERLLAGVIPDNKEAAPLVVLVDLIRAEGAGSPSEVMVAEVAREAAMLARATSSASVLTRAQPPRRWAGWRLRPQLVMAATAVLLFSGVSGVAIAANGAAPGDPLYGIDRALEKIGIGAGHAQERLAEANSLLSDGDAREALRHAAQVFDETDDVSEALEIQDARAALENAAGSLDDDDGATSNDLVRDNVSTLLEYLRENLGKQVGADGKDFGQGVADLAHEIAPGQGQRPTPGPPNDNEPQDDEVGGPQSGGSGNGGGNSGGNGGNGAPGNSGTAPGRNQDS